MLLKASVIVFVAFFGCISGAPNDVVDSLLPDGRIVGGFDLNITQAPWQVSLQMGVHTYNFCGGSVIGKQWILTAAHCIHGKSASSFVVKAGATHVYNDGQYFYAEKLIPHPRYDRSRIDFDFGLIKLRKVIVFSDKIQPIALPDYTDDNVAAGTMCFVSGWGLTQQGGVLSKILQGVETPIFDQKYCKKVYEEVNTVTSRMICAGHKEGGKNPCNGDSGGALVSYEKGTKKPVVIGVVSWSKGCARPGYPTVYGRIIAAREWIHSHTNL